MSDEDRTDGRRKRYGAFNPKPSQPEEPFPTNFKFPNGELANVLNDMELGAGVAEQDDLLKDAKIDTAALSDLLRDKVDIIPGTKGSGKSAIFRIFVDYLHLFLLDSQGIVCARGVTKTGDPVFNAYKDEFESFTEDDFQNFWSIYLVALAHAQLISIRLFEANPKYKRAAENQRRYFDDFNKRCVKGNIPVADPKAGLLDVFKHAIDWVLRRSPEVTYELPNEAGSVNIKLGNDANDQAGKIPNYIVGLRDSMDAALSNTDLKLWFMIDRLDEVFPRRSIVERLAMRGLLRTVRIFATSNIRVKLFIRDDMFDEITGGQEGFTALTHVTARMAARLYWTEDQLLALIVKRVCLNQRVTRLIGADMKRIEQDSSYRERVFYAIFPKIVDGGAKGSPTMRWMFNHLCDGRGVVTPRDLIKLINEAREFQLNQCRLAPQGECTSIISAKSLKHALMEVSKVKCSTYLFAEFPHLSKEIKKLVGGKTQLDSKTLSQHFGKNWERVVEDLVAIGLLRMEKTAKKTQWKIPFVYRAGLKLTQGAHNDHE